MAKKPLKKKIMKRKTKFDPIDREILRVLSNAKMPATPCKVARTITIHPATAKVRMKKMSRMGLVNVKKRGNRMLVKANKAAIKKRMKK